MVLLPNDKPSGFVQQLVLLSSFPQDLCNQRQKRNDYSSTQNNIHSQHAHQANPLSRQCCSKTEKTSTRIVTLHLHGCDKRSGVLWNQQRSIYYNLELGLENPVPVSYGGEESLDSSKSLLNVSYIFSRTLKTSYGDNCIIMLCFKLFSIFA